MTNRYGAHISVAGGTLVLTLTCVAIYLAIGILDALMLLREVARCLFMIIHDPVLNLMSRIAHPS